MLISKRFLFLLVLWATALYPRHLYAQPTETQIYISDFTGASSASLRRSLTRVFQVELLRVGRGVKAFTRKDLSDLLQREQYKEMLECDDLSCVREIVANFGIAMSAFGVVDSLGGGDCDLTIKIFDREDPVWAGNELTTCDIRTLRELVKKFATQFAEKTSEMGQRANPPENDQDNSAAKYQVHSQPNSEDVLSIGSLMWQKQQNPNIWNWDGANQYCENLSLGGFSDWRLPSIGELRSLIQTCPKTRTGGACRVADDCRDWSRCSNDFCKGCPEEYSQQNSCLQPDGFSGRCPWLWSSSSYSDYNPNAWGVNLLWGQVSGLPKNMKNGHARCVRGKNSDR